MIQRYLIGLALAGIVAGAFWYQHSQLQAQTERAVTAEQISAQQLAITTQLQQQSATRARALSALTKTTSAIRNAISQRDNTIRRLERENDEYRQWAANLLPAAAQRLRQRPAITGAGGYQQYLSADQPLQPAPQPARNERRPDG